MWQLQQLMALTFGHSVWVSTFSPSLNCGGLWTTVSNFFFFSSFQQLQTLQHASGLCKWDKDHSHRWLWRGGGGLGGAWRLLMTSSTAFRQSADQLGAAKSPDYNPLCLAPNVSITHYTPINFTCNDHIRLLYPFTTSEDPWGALPQQLHVFGTREAKFSRGPCGTCAGLPGRKSTCVLKEGRKPILRGAHNNKATVKTIQVAHTTVPELWVQTKQVCCLHATNS